MGGIPATKTVLDSEVVPSMEDLIEEAKEKDKIPTMEDLANGQVKSQVAA